MQTIIVAQHVYQKAANELLTIRVSGDLPVRLLGMGVSDIARSGVTQTQLFDEGDRRKQDRLDKVGDLLRERFGSQALLRGSTLEHEAKHRPRPKQ